MKPIPLEWIKRYVDSLVEAAEFFDGATIRADAILKMVQAYREDSCEHYWACAKNEFVSNGEVCLRCGKLRPTICPDPVK